MSAPFSLIDMIKTNLDVRKEQPVELEDKVELMIATKTYRLATPDLYILLLC